MPLPLIPLIIGATTAVTTIGGIVAYNVTKKDEYSPCVKFQLKAGIPPEKAAAACAGAREPSLMEKALTPLIMLAGIVVAIPPIIAAVRKK